MVFFSDFSDIAGCWNTVSGTSKFSVSVNRVLTCSFCLQAQEEKRIAGKNTHKIFFGTFILLYIMFVILTKGKKFSWLDGTRTYSQ